MAAAEVHFHFGVGKIGLGLVAPFFATHSPLPFIPLAREASTNDYYGKLNAENRYRLRYYDTGEQRDVPLRSVERYRPEEPESIYEVVERHGIPSVVSCSVGVDQVEPLFPIIDALLRMKDNPYRKRPLLFLPFENSKRAASDLYQHLRSKDEPLHSMAIPMDMVIDKVCAEVESEGGLCTVIAESFEEFFLSQIDWDTPPRGLKQRLAALGLGSQYLERPQFEFQRQKKTWVINGLHYCIALSVYELALGTATIADAMKDPRVMTRAHNFAMNVMFALLAGAQTQSPALHPAQLHINDYVERALDRMGKSRFDKSSRIVPAIQFLVEELDLMALRERKLHAAPSFTTFFDKWEERVLAPTRILLQHHLGYRDQLYLPELTNALLRVLAETIPVLEEYAVNHLDRKRARPL